MTRRFIEFFKSLVVTIDLYLFDRELYNAITQPMTIEDFVDAERPE